MNQYERQNAVHKIDGYFLPRPLEPRSDTFARAKAECLSHLRAALQHVESVTLEQFNDERRSGSLAAVEPQPTAAAAPGAQSVVHLWGAETTPEVVAFLRQEVQREVAASE